jgi:hypothetical protein
MGQATTMQQPKSADALLRRDIEAWLLNRGAPHFVEGYRSATNVWARSFPVLVGLWALGLVAVVGFSENVRVLAVFGAIAAVIALWVIPNVFRKRRPFSRPDTTNTAEMLFFVVSPVLLTIVLNRSAGSAIVCALISGFGVAAVYFTTGYGLVAITKYVINRLGDQAKLLGKLSSRAIPLLLLITVTIFLTGETWIMSSNLDGLSQFATLGLFVLAGGLFLFSRVPGEVAAVELFDDWAEIARMVAATPASAVLLPESGNPVEPSVSRGQRINLSVMALTTQAVQITLVALIVYVFFVLLGLVAVPPATATGFMGAAPHVLASLKIGSSTFALSTELLRAAGFLAAFSGMAFTVYLVTDSTYREEFASDVSTELREVLAVRVAYLHHLDQLNKPSSLAAKSSNQIKPDER